MKRSANDLIQAYARFAVERRFWLLAAVAVVVSATAAGLLKLRFNTTFRVWHPPESEVLRTFDQATAKFGSDNVVLVAWEDERGVVRNESLEVVRRVTERLGKVGSVKRVDSLASFSIARAGRRENETPALAVTRTHVAAAGDHGDVMVWSRADWSASSIGGHDGLVTSLAASPDGTRLYSGGLDRTIRVHALPSGETVDVYRGLPESVSVLSLSADGAYLYAGSYETAHVFSTATGARVAVLDGLDEFATTIAHAPGGGTLVIASRAIAVYRTSDHQRVQLLEGHTGSVTGLAFSPGGETLYSSGDDGRVIAWDLASGKPRKLLDDGRLMILSLLLSRDGKHVLAGASDGTIWSIPADGSWPVKTRIHDDWVVDLALGEGNLVYSASRDRNVAVHAPGEGPRVVILEAHRGAARRVFAEPGLLLSSGDDGDVYVWNPAEYEVVARLPRSLEPAAPPARPLAGDGRAAIDVRNGFRFPVEIRVGGVARAQLGGGRAGAIADLPVRAPIPCEDESSCAEGQYCDYELEEPVCTSRAVVEAWLPERSIRLWRGEATLIPGDSTAVQMPADDPFVVSEVAESPMDPRTRGAALLAAFPADKGALEAAMAKVFGRYAGDPNVFVSPSAAGEIVAALPGEVSEELRRFLTTVEQAKLTSLQLPLLPQVLREQKRHLLRGPKPVAVGAVMSAATDATLLVASLHLDEGKDPLGVEAKIIEEFKGVLAEERERTGYDFMLAGDAVQDTALYSYAQRDMRELFPLFVGMLLLVIALWYRRVVAFAVPISMVVGIGVTMGIGGLLGVELNNMTVAVPQVVLACCLGDANHMLTYYFDRLRVGESREAAIRHALAENFVPCLWTSVTTSLGFMSLMTASVQPIQTFGWLSGIGALVAWFLTFTLFPALLSFLPAPRNLRSADEERAASSKGFLALVERAMTGISRYVSSIPGTMLFMTAVVLGVAGYGLKEKISFDTNTLEFFSKEAPFRRAAHFVEEKLSGPFGLRIMVETGQAGGIRKVEYLESIAKLQEHLEAHPLVTTVIGLADIQKSMSRAMNQDVEDAWHLPETDQQASSYYSMFSFSLRAGLDLTNRVSADESSTLVDIRLKNLPSGSIIAFGEELAEWAKTNVPNLQIAVTGSSWAFAKMLTDMARNFFENMSGAVLTISLTLFLVAFSLRLGLVAVLVNVSPLIVTVGFMSLAGVTMDLATLVASCVALGIVVDDTIHYVTKYKRYIGKGLTHDQAAAEIARGHGKSSMLTMLILNGGFLMFLLTDYMVNRNFGIMTATMLLVGWLFDLLVHPAALKLFGGARKA